MNHIWLHCFTLTLSITHRLGTISFESIQAQHKIEGKLCRIITVFSFKVLTFAKKKLFKN